MSGITLMKVNMVADHHRLTDAECFTNNSGTHFSFTLKNDNGSVIHVVLSPNDAKIIIDKWKDGINKMLG